MKIIVISLRGSVRRRKSIRWQFGALDIPFEFFDAVPGIDASQHIHHHDEHEFRINTGRTATINEIGCYASHLSVWRQCASGNEPVLILEDDAKLSIQFSDGLQAIRQVIHDRGFVRAAMPTVTSSIAIEKIRSFRLRYCRRVPLRALAYAITPAVAVQLAAQGSVVEEPVDKFIQRFWRHQQPIFALRPYIVHLSPESRLSDIGDRVREAYTFSFWLRRAIRKADNSVRRELFNLRFQLSTRWRRNAARRLATRVPANTNPHL